MHTGRLNAHTVCAVSTYGFNKKRYHLCILHKYFENENVVRFTSSSRNKETVIAAGLVYRMRGPFDGDATNMTAAGEKYDDMERDERRERIISKKRCNGRQWLERRRR